MRNNKRLKIEIFTQDDLPFVQQLTPEGWDDLTPAFQRYLNYPFCTPMKAVIDGRMIGAGTMIYFEDTAWVAAIVVDSECRNNGYGYAITKALVDSVDTKKYKTIFLDATEYGYPVYKKLGFEVFSEHLHFTGSLKGNENIASEIQPFEDKYAEQVLALDKVVTNENRAALLRMNLKDAVVYLSQNSVLGVCYPTFSRGAIIAADTDAGIALMRYRLHTKEQCMFPVENTTAADFLLNNGLQHVNTTRRMRLGLSRTWQPQNIYNVINGGYG